MTVPPALATTEEPPKLVPESVLSRTSTLTPSVRTLAASARVPAAASPSRDVAATVPSEVHDVKSLDSLGAAMRWCVSAPSAGSIRARSSAPSAGTAAAHGPSGSLPLYQRCQRSRTVPTSRSNSRTRRYGRALADCCAASMVALNVRIASNPAAYSASGRAPSAPAAGR